MLTVRCLIAVAAFAFASSANAGSIAMGPMYNWMVDQGVTEFALEVDGVAVQITAGEEWDTYTLEFDRAVKVNQVYMWSPPRSTWAQRACTRSAAPTAKSACTT